MSVASFETFGSGSFGGPLGVRWVVVVLWGSGGEGGEGGLGGPEALLLAKLIVICFPFVHIGTGDPGQRSGCVITDVIGICI